ncbi:hypothetical protein [Nitrosospira briensis]|uniref:hypothetical protein n=1 Tax=Nitrosospira briensis TaxID=35799 RepID=UPI000469CFE7|nr:hypothetical protein [Nitrosospira briensis]
MTKSHQEDQDKPFFITEDGPPDNLLMPPHRIQNLPQILAGLTDHQLSRWPGDLADVERGDGTRP